MIPVTETISLDENDIQTDFIHSSGPGGQNVNKVATAVQLRFRVTGNTSLPAAVRERLARLAGKRMTATGELILTARRFRTQERNRRDAVERLVGLVRKAAEPPVSRRATRPTPQARAERLEHKKRRGRIKQERRWTPDDEG